MTDTDVLIIGAGLAGLGAAAALRDAGRRSIVLEASGRAGGRAWTAYPAALGGVWFDMGAVWFHDAEHNPLAAIAQAAGDPVIRSDELRQTRMFIGDRLATQAELADYDAASSRYEAMAERVLAAGADVPLAEIARRLRDDPWARTIEAWEGPVICAADAERFSARDWHRNALNGSNLVPDGGIGAFVLRRLTAGLDIRRDTPVTRVRWGGPGGRVSVETARGALSAGACIVTVSTGVLERIPPSQNSSPPIRTAGKAGGKAPEAMIWLIDSVSSRLSAKASRADQGAETASAAPPCNTRLRSMR